MKANVHIPVAVVTLWVSIACGCGSTVVRTDDRPADAAEPDDGLGTCAAPTDPALASAMARTTDSGGSHGIYVSGLGSLQGVECDPAITGLYATDSHVATLAPLRFTQLLGMEWSHSELGDFFAPSSLKRLSFDDSKVPFEQIGALPALRIFMAEDEPALVNIDFLAASPELTTIGLRNVGVTSLAPLAATRLDYIRIEETPVGSLAPLAGLTSLTQLTLTDTLVTSLAPLDRQCTAQCCELRISGRTALDDESVHQIVPHMCSLGWAVEYTAPDGTSMHCGQFCPMD